MSVVFTSSAINSRVPLLISNFQERFDQVPRRNRYRLLKMERDLLALTDRQLILMRSMGS